MVKEVRPGLGLRFLSPQNPLHCKFIFRPLTSRKTMNIIFSILGVLCILVGAICTVLVLVDAFKDKVWKGFLCILCGLYYLYYAFVDFDHDKKWTVVFGSLLGSGLGSLFLSMAQG
jgi:uncharacterized membrane protein HdeD (DUF308 family)